MDVNAIPINIYICTHCKEVKMKAFLPTAAVPMVLSKCDQRRQRFNTWSGSPDCPGTYRFYSTLRDCVLSTVSTRKPNGG